MGAVPAMADIRADMPEKLLGVIDAHGRINHRLGLCIVVLGQSFDLFDIEHAVTLHKGNLALFLAAIVLLFGLGDRVGVYHQIAAFALLHMCAKFLGLFEGHPERGEIPLLNSYAPQHQDIDAIIRHAIVSQRFGDLAFKVAAAPRFEPCQLALLQIGNNLVGHSFININFHSISPFLDSRLRMQPY